jgi:hypothetical protein
MQGRLYHWQRGFQRAWALVQATMDTVWPCSQPCRCGQYSQTTVLLDSQLSVAPDHRRLCICFFCPSASMFYDVRGAGWNPHGDKKHISFLNAAHWIADIQASLSPASQIHQLWSHRRIILVGRHPEAQDSIDGEKEPRKQS